MVATAHADADQLTAASQAEADQLTSSARAEADQLLAAARTEAQRVADEVEQHRTSRPRSSSAPADALADVAEAKATLEAQVDHLQQLEREHVERMRTYLTGQLDQLERVARHGRGRGRPRGRARRRGTRLRHRRLSSATSTSERALGPPDRGRAGMRPRHRGCHEMFTNA